jgi:predicted NBD/HSP70 family sugar kinase
VTRLTAELIELGLLEELAPVASTDVGRRRVPVDVQADRVFVAGVHIGLQWTTYGLVDLRGRVVDGPHKIVHADTAAGPVIDEVVAAVADLVSSTPSTSSVIGTGISSGGTVRPAVGTVADHDALGWHDVDVIGRLAGRLDGLVAVESTYRAMANAEMWFGAARDIRSFAQVFLGRVYGAAFVFDGVLHDGMDLRGGEIGHLPVSGSSSSECRCGRTNCLSSATSPRTTIERAQAAGLRTVQSVGDVAELARDGDERATGVLRTRAEAIGEALALLVDILAPERIVLAGAALLGDDDLATVRRVVEGMVRHPFDAEAVVVPTALGSAGVANVVASATPALRLFYDDPIEHAPSTLTPVGASR